LQVAPLKPDLIPAEEEEDDYEPKEELQVEKVVDDEGVTETSMKVVTQIMAMKSSRKRKALIKKYTLTEKELAVVKYFELSLRSKSSWWNCCGGAAGKMDLLN